MTRPAAWRGSRCIQRLAGRVTFSASDTDVVRLCAGYTTPHGSDSICYENSNTQIPPTHPYDPLHPLFEMVDDTSRAADSLVCGAFKTARLPQLVNVWAHTTWLAMDPDDCDLWYWGDGSSTSTRTRTDGTGAPIPGRKAGRRRGGDGAGPEAT